MSVRHWIVAVVAVSAVAVLPTQASAGTPGQWERLTQPDGRNIDQVTHLRTADGVLHVAWVHQSGNADTLFHAPIAANGSIGGMTPIQANWASINPVPDLVPGPGGGLRVFFGGLRTTDSGETNDEMSTATAPAAGQPWTLQSGNVTPGGAAAYASDTGAALLADGTPLESFGGTGTGVYVHRGLSPSSPNHAYQGQLGGCCGYSPDIAVDSTNGVPVIAWYSNADNNLGVFVQLVDPATGAPVGAPARMPGSVTNFEGTPSSSQMLSRTPITARTGQPGIFVAYPGGYPTTRKVLVWRVGGDLDTLANTGNNHLVGLAPTPDGRLWAVFAELGVKQRVFARRSNPDVTAWGPRVAAGAPKGTISIYKVDGNAQANTLDIFALISNSSSTANWHTQVLPGLALDADPRKVNRNSGTSVTFTVTDPDPVEDAKVTAAGESGKTNAKGRVTLQLGPFGKKKKKVKAIATKPGYTDTLRKLKIKRN